MCAWAVDDRTIEGVLQLRLEGLVSVEDMLAFVRAHDSAIDAYAGKDYRVFCDIRGLRPLSPECTTLFEAAKAYSARHRNFRGSAVLVDSSLLALQHKRTSVASGVISTEIITDDEKRCWDHLARVHRSGAEAPASDRPRSSAR